MRLRVTGLNRLCRANLYFFIRQEIRRRRLRMRSYAACETALVHDFTVNVSFTRIFTRCLGITFILRYITYIIIT